MSKLNFTREELEAKYREKLDIYLEDCDWVTYVDGKTVCYFISKILKEFDIEIEPNNLYEKYDIKVDSLMLTDEQWRNTYGITEIIELIYTLIEEEF